jgi:hypothetical protein
MPPLTQYWQVPLIVLCEHPKMLEKFVNYNTDEKYTVLIIGIGRIEYIRKFIPTREQIKN